MIPSSLSPLPFPAQHLDKVDREEGQYKCRNMNGEGQDRVPIVFVIRSVYQGEYQPGKIPGSHGNERAANNIFPFMSLGGSSVQGTYDNETEKRDAV